MTSIFLVTSEMVFTLNITKETGKAATMPSNRAKKDESFLKSYMGTI